MSNYRKILAAVDVGSEAVAVLERAADLSRRHGAELYAIHAIEPIVLDPGYEGMPTLPVEIYAEVEQAARSMLEHVAEEFGIPANNRILVQGMPKNVIVEFAREEGIGLIVIGSHGRHGLQRLLGSTAHGVLHGAPCDVVAVRL